MKIPPNDVLVRAFKRGWAMTVQALESPGRQHEKKTADVLISGGIVEVIRAIEEYKIPPTTVDGFQTVEILAKDKRGRTVIVKASVFDGVLSCFKTEETQPAPKQYAVDRRFQDILGLNANPENLFGPAGTSRNNVCECKIEMATFRHKGSLCPHCGNVVPATTKGD